MKWAIQLLGDTSDLSALAKTLIGSDVNVTHDGKDYLMTSDRFDGPEDAAAIHASAKEIVAVLSGACRLALDATQPLKVGAVHRCHPDGRRDVIVFPEPAAIRCRLISPTVKLTHNDGSVEEFNPADPVKHWMELALSCDAVAKVFHLLSAGTLDWVNLNRIIEIVKADVGGWDAIADNGWAAEKSAELFTRTANSPDAAGLESRHGSSTKKPPRKPMLISEARSLTSSIVHAWLRSKTG